MGVLRENIARLFAKAPGEQYTVAARWWADVLRENAEHDNGDATQSHMLNFTRKYVKGPTPEQIDKFEMALAVKMAILGNDFKMVSTDYHPDQTLTAAAISAGFEGKTLMSVFPCKTCLWLEPTRTLASVGYRARAETIWKKEGNHI